MRIDSFKNSLAARALARVEHKAGINAAVGVAYENIWAVAATYTFLSAAGTLYMASSDQLNDPGLAITIEGLDTNWQRQVVTQTLSPVDARIPILVGTTTTTWMRVNKAYVSDATAITGNVSIAREDAGTWVAGAPGTATTTQAYVAATQQESKQTVFSSSSNEEAFIFLLDLINNSADATTFRLSIREFGSTFIVKYTSPVVNNATFVKEWYLPLVVKSRSDVIVEAIATAAADVAVDLEILRN